MGSGQSWYCGCGAKRMAPYGQVVEPAAPQSDGMAQRLHCRAPPPHSDVTWEAVALMAERAYPAVLSADEPQAPYPALPAHLR